MTIVYFVHTFILSQTGDSPEDEHAPPTSPLKISVNPKFDKKFEKLEILIKEKHSQLMQSRHREDNQPLKDVADKPMACTVEVYEKEVNVDPQSRKFKFDKQPSSPIKIDLADTVGVAADEVGVFVNEGEHQVHANVEIDHTISNQRRACLRTPTHR
ncbi:hypothetical protein RDI58_020031 [Solanum bulbocastanum]|uniref:Uncharacterized protein n=1 Tax=Solanum bulbocastanum TaxID=147425 RepID=A0AAN8T7Y1_SOLBU